MSQIPGSVRLTGFIAPTDSSDTYPVTDPKWGLGGLRKVANITERDAISSLRRELGMFVYVIEEDTYYTLKTGLNNSDWEELYFGENVYTGNADTEDIVFDKRVIYNTATNPATGTTINADLAITPKLGKVQKIYHNHPTNEPAYLGATWVPIGDGIYMSNQLNIIYCEWASDNRIEYWITQERS